MTPKFIDYIDGRIVITPDAFIIKELNDLINKHGDGTPSGGGAEPYIAYVHLMTWPESAYINLPEEEMCDSIIYDIVQSIGDFDPDDELIAPAIARLSKVWDSKPKRYYRALGIAMDKASTLLETEELSSGRDGNLAEINRMIEKAGSTLKSYKMVEKEVDAEIKTKMKGKSTLGDY